MSQAPKTYDEYIARTKANTKIEGFGIGNVHCTNPCLFCGAPDFMKYEVLEVEKVIQKEHTCGECGRSAKALVKNDNGGIQFEMVQTGGPDQPDYFKPPMRRLA